MPIADLRSFVDSNVLVYAATPAAPQHQASRALLESGGALCVSPQVFAEFYSVVTNPRRVTIPFTPAEARAFIRVLLPRVEILPIPKTVVERWSQLAEEHNAAGAEVYDLQLGATMLDHGVSRIYTYNQSDFESFAELTVIAPS